MPGPVVLDDPGEAEAPPLPRLYSEAFFESLRKYLPHVRQLKFLGGEPFLISEYYSLWDRLIADGLSVSCHVTTNGTQYNKRVERVLEHVRMGFAVSMDGATKATLEAIRGNARYEEVMENAQRFREYARERKTWFFGHLLPDAPELARVGDSPCWRIPGTARSGSTRSSSHRSSGSTACLRRS